MSTRSKRGSSEPLASLPGEGDDDNLTPEQLRAKYGAPAPVKSLSELEQEAKGAPPSKKQKVADNFFNAPTPNGFVATLTVGDGIVECSFGSSYAEAKGLIPEELMKASTVEDEFLTYTGTLEDAKRLFLAAGFNVMVEDFEEGEGDEGDVGEDDGLDGEEGDDDDGDDDGDAD